MRVGRLSEAVEWAELLREEDPTDAFADFVHCLAAHAEGNFLIAVHYGQSALRGHDLPESGRTELRVALADSLAKTGQRTAALGLFTRLERDGRQTEAAVPWAQLLLRQGRAGAGAVSGVNARGGGVSLVLRQKGTYGLIGH